VEFYWPRTERGNQPVPAPYSSESRPNLRSQAIEDTATDRLRTSPHIRTSRVSCQFSRGVLRLRGRLATYFQKQVAQETVRGIEGVTDIVNEIEVGR
jgi:osmotically-inducible protein OsmY